MDITSLNTDNSSQGFTAEGLIFILENEDNQFIEATSIEFISNIPSYFQTLIESSTSTWEPTSSWALLIVEDRFVDFIIPLPSAKSSYLPTLMEVETPIAPSYTKKHHFILQNVQKRLCN